VVGDRSGGCRPWYVIDHVPGTRGAAASLDRRASRCRRGPGTSSTCGRGHVLEALAAVAPATSGCRCTRGPPRQTGTVHGRADRLVATLRKEAGVKRHIEPAYCPVSAPGAGDRAGPAAPPAGPWARYDGCWPTIRRRPRHPRLLPHTGTGVRRFARPPTVRRPPTALITAVKDEGRDPY